MVDSTSIEEALDEQQRHRPPNRLSQIAGLVGSSPMPVRDDQGKVQGWRLDFPEVRAVDRHIDRKPQIRIRPVGRPMARAPRLATNTRTRGSRRGRPQPRAPGDDDPPGEQLDLELSCVDGTAHANVTNCFRCGWNAVDGRLPFGGRS